MGIVFDWVYLHGTGSGRNTGTTCNGSFLDRQRRAAVQTTCGAGNPARGTTVAARWAVFDHRTKARDSPGDGGDATALDGRRDSERHGPECTARRLDRCRKNGNRAKDRP